MIRRADPAFLPKLASIREQKSFTDPRQPGTVYEFDFAILCEGGESDEWFLTDRAKRLEMEYVIGGKTVDVDGVYLPIERQLCINIALMIEAEILAQGESSWTFPQWVVLTRKSPDLWRQIQEWYKELFARARPAIAKSLDGGDDADIPGEPVKNA